MKLTRLIAAALTAVCIFTLTSCKQEDTQATANDYPVHVADTVVDHRPKKVVSLAPALTDTLFQLQIAGRVVAISDYCDLPAQPWNTMNIPGPAPSSFRILTPSRNWALIWC